MGTRLVQEMTLQRHELQNQLNRALGIILVLILKVNGNMDELHPIFPSSTLETTKYTSKYP